MLKEQSRKPEPPKKRATAGKQHAAIGIPQDDEEVSRRSVAQRGAHTDG